MALRLAVSQSLPDKKEVKKPQIRMDDEILTEVLGKTYGCYILNDRKSKRLIYVKKLCIFFLLRNALAQLNILC